MLNVSFVFDRALHIEIRRRFRPPSTAARGHTPACWAARRHCSSAGINDTVCKVNFRQGVGGVRVAIDLPPKVANAAFMSAAATTINRCTDALNTLRLGGHWHAEEGGAQGYKGGWCNSIGRDDSGAGLMAACVCVGHDLDGWGCCGGAGRLSYHLPKSTQPFSFSNPQPSSTTPLLHGEELSSHWPAMRLLGCGRSTRGEREER